MTESLTEQKDVYLGDGYVGIEEEIYNADDTIQNFKTNEYKELVSNSYELVQKMHILEKRLDIATKALEKIERIKVTRVNNFSIIIAHSYSKEALKEMEGVK